MRKMHGISVEATIVILDEAHNIVSMSACVRIILQFVNRSKLVKPLPHLT